MRLFVEAAAPSPPQGAILELDELLETLDMLELELRLLGILELKLLLKLDELLEILELRLLERDEERFELLELAELATGDSVVS